MVVSPKNHKYLQVEFEALKHGLQTSAFVKTFEGKVNYTEVHNLVVRGFILKVFVKPLQNHRCLRQGRTENQHRRAAVNFIGSEERLLKSTAVCCLKTAPRAQFLWGNAQGSTYHTQY